jgi:hypothetical protein
MQLPPTPRFFAFLSLVIALALASPAWAQEEEEPAPAGQDDDPPAAGDDTPAAADDDKADEPPAGGADDDKAEGDDKPDGAGDADNDGTPDAADNDDDNDDDNDAPVDADDLGAPDPSDDAAEAAEDDAQDVAVQTDEDGEPYIEADYDGDGVVEADELAEEKEFDTAFADIPDEVSDAALDKRPDDANLEPSITVEHFRQLVRLAKRKVLARLEAKIEKSAAARMRKIAIFVSLFSLTGFLLLFMPLALRKKYPGQGANLLKYSALAAVTFFVTVNLFGAIVLGMRGAQGAVGNQTNPQLRLAAGFFDTLDHNAPRYVVTGRELFAPTLEALDGKSDEQPAALLIANGQKVVKKASVFVRIAKMFKQVAFVFGVVPIVLLGVTMLLFVLSIKPTLVEIIKLPAAAASGELGAGSGVVKRALRRVGGEMLATLCTLGVLLVMTMFAGFVMGRVVEPMLDTLITCFARAIDYLQFVDDASAGKVGLMLFSVILALVLNLAVVIASMSFFLGKTQKIFQQRFTHGVPLGAHERWWRWAIPSVVLALLLPLVYLAVAKVAIGGIERKIMDAATSAEKVNWTLLMFASPLLLTIGFGVFLWAARGLKAILFMARYQVKPPAMVVP